MINFIYKPKDGYVSFLGEVQAEYCIVETLVAHRDEDFPETQALPPEGKLIYELRLIDGVVQVYQLCDDSYCVAEIAWWYDGELIRQHTVAYYCVERITLPAAPIIDPFKGVFDEEE